MQKQHILFSFRKMLQRSAVGLSGTDRKYQSDSLFIIFVESSTATFIGTSPAEQIKL